MRFVGADMLEELFSELQEMYAHVEIIAIHATYFVYAYIIWLSYMEQIVCCIWLPKLPPCNGGSPNHKIIYYDKQTDY